MALLAPLRDRFVSIDDTPASWLLLLVIIVVLLSVDLYRHRDDHEPSTREALIESSAWVVCGLLFGGFVAWTFGAQAFGEYISGYLIEKSLSVDNVFVWSMLFTTLAIPLRYHHRVLFWGIFGALVLRAGFIAGGTALITRFAWVMVVFGVFLVFTGIRVVTHDEDEGEGAERGLKFLRRFMPVTNRYDGHKFFTRIGGKRYATPLLAALIVVEFTDLIFAVDSVPAILAVSHEPYLVFSANAFAILGLRAMYFLLASTRARFHYLSHGLGAVLVFVGVKMSVANWYHLDTYVSLAVIAVILTAAIVFSELKTRRLRQEAASEDQGRPPG